jgi:hypothetical protein
MDVCNMMIKYLRLLLSTTTVRNANKCYTLHASEAPAANAAAAAPTSHPAHTQKKIQNPCYQIRYCTKVISTRAILVSFCLQQHALLSQSMR